ncbi:glycerol-3-phosphate responsive antiterminator [Bacillus fonticola]|uniref:glycerol-3-phosphate responsive antiterminator n=1 Tax=Bacillus fonticola TaxID=2728853 RepID=UPI00147565CE|nr:glycerol-3-phosphate responsive antiterminator [Bacillus fonticola]
MNFDDQYILPAVRSMKEFDKMLETSYTCGVFLDVHVGMLKSIFAYARQQERKMFLHADLIQGLKNDEYAAEYLAQEIKPYGIISTKGSTIQKARQKDVFAIQRAFIIDSSALERSVQLVKKTNPDFIEILPGVVPKVISQMKERTGKPIIAGGLIDSKEEVEAAIKAGATAVSTSNQSLWKVFDQRD